MRSTRADDSASLIDPAILAEINAVRRGTTALDCMLAEFHNMRPKYFADLSGHAQGLISELHDRIRANLRFVLTVRRCLKIFNFFPGSAWEVIPANWGATRPEQQRSYEQRNGRSDNGPKRFRR